MNVEFELDAQKLKKAFGLKTRLTHLDAPLKGMANYLETKTKRQFDTETDPDGDRWGDLKETTWARKKTNKILTETGKLRDSIQGFVRDKKAGVRATADYAKYHQFGTSKMIARVIIGVNLEDKKECAKILKVYVRSRKRL